MPTKKHSEAPTGLNPASIFNDPIPQTDESKLVDVINGVMATDGIAVRTVLEKKHVVAITKGVIFAEKYNSDLMRLLCQTLRESMISVDGRGRKDLIAAMKAAIPSTVVPEVENQKRLSRFF